MFYRMIMQIVYLKDNVLYKPITKAVKSFMIKKAHCVAM